MSGRNCKVKLIVLEG